MIVNLMLMRMAVVVLMVRNVGIHLGRGTKIVEKIKDKVQLAMNIRTKQTRSKCPARIRMLRERRGVECHCSGGTV